MLQTNKKTTVSGAFAAGATSLTLASAAFTNFTNGFLVIDYDVDAKLEVIKCTVTGTAVSSITRGQDGTSDVAHSSGAKIGFMFVPSHYDFIGARATLAATLGTTVSAVYTKVLLDTETYDVGSNFASNKFTAPYNGYYSINATIAYTSATTAKEYYCAVYKNGALSIVSSCHSNTGTFVAPSVSDTIYLAATDYIELFYYHDGATTVDINSTVTALAVTLVMRT